MQRPFRKATFSSAPSAFPSRLREAGDTWLSVLGPSDEEPPRGCFLGHKQPQTIKPWDKEQSPPSVCLPPQPHLTPEGSKGPWTQPEAPEEERRAWEASRTLGKDSLGGGVAGWESPSLAFQSSERRAALREPLNTVASAWRVRELCFAWGGGVLLSGAPLEGLAD